MELIRSHTRLVNIDALRLPSGAPLRLWQADAITPIWEATEATLSQQGMEPPFWAFAWAGGQAVARFILAQPERFCGGRILDIGCGSGLISIVAAAIGAQAVYANDTDPLCEAALILNSEANNVDVNWLSGNLLACPPPSVDIILAGDVFYEKEMSRSFIEWLKMAAAAGIKVYAGDPGRTYAPGVNSAPLAEYEISTSTELEGVTSRKAIVWQITS